MDAAEMWGHASPMVAPAHREQLPGERESGRPVDGIYRRPWQPFPFAGLGRPHRRNAARPTPDARAAAAYQHATDEHQPQRPTWRCAGCAEPWPCPTARAYLVRVVGPVQLAMIMATRLTEAATDLPGPEPGELWDRFVAWTRRGGQPS